MKKALLFNFSLFLFCMSCNTNGHRGVSASISDSQQRRTFLYSCTIFASNKEASDSLLPNIKEAFVEKSWFVDKPESTNDSDFLNIVMITSHNVFFEKHAIGDFTFTGKNKMILNVDRSMLTDTLKFGLFQRDNLYTRDNGKKLGDVYIVKKNAY